MGTGPRHGAIRPPPHRRIPNLRRSLVVAAVLLPVAAIAAGPVRSMLLGASVVVRLAGLGGVPDTLARATTTRASVSVVRVPARGGPLKARLYRPAGKPRRALLVAPGVHAGGMDEPRLVHFARVMAESGSLVLTPELPDLKAFRVTAHATDQIEDAALWLSDQPETGGRVHLVGVSFAGGLSVVAASRPSLHGRLASVMSFGGHGDLRRVMRYLCTGEEPDGSIRPPHDYGVAVILLEVADELVPPGQGGPLREAVAAFLGGAHDEARQRGKALPEPAASLMYLVNTRNATALGAVLLPLVERLPDAPTLSPGRAPPPEAPVFLLHGKDDNVIPAAESVLLARHLEGRAEVHLLVSSLITHVEVDRDATTADIWRMIRFWARFLAAA